MSNNQKSEGSGNLSNQSPGINFSLTGNKNESNPFGGQTLFKPGLVGELNPKTNWSKKQQPNSSSEMQNYNVFGAHKQNPFATKSTFTTSFANLLGNNPTTQLFKKSTTQQKQAGITNTQSSKQQQKQKTTYQNKQDNKTSIFSFGGTQNTPNMFNFGISKPQEKIKNQKDEVKAQAKLNLFQPFKSTNITSSFNPFPNAQPKTSLFNLKEAEQGKKMQNLFAKNKQYQKRIFDKQLNKSTQQKKSVVSSSSPFNMDTIKTGPPNQLFKDIQSKETEKNIQKIPSKYQSQITTLKKPQTYYKIILPPVIPPIIPQNSNNALIAPKYIKFETKTNQQKQLLNQIEDDIQKGRQITSKQQMQAILLKARNQRKQQLIKFLKSQNKNVILRNHNQQYDKLAKQRINVLKKQNKQLQQQRQQLIAQTQALSSEIQEQIQPDKLNATIPKPQFSKIQASVPLDSFMNNFYEGLPSKQLVQSHNKIQEKNQQIHKLQKQILQLENQNQELAKQEQKKKNLLMNLQNEVIDIFQDQEQFKQYCLEYFGKKKAQLLQRYQQLKKQVKDLRKAKPKSNLSGKMSLII